MDVADEKELGRAIRARRKKIGMTIAELASVIPCSPRLLSELERGQRGVSIAVAFRLIQMLGLIVSVRGSEEG
ncbi:MAG: helix-turn-helix transcriptional regulator [Akkermansia sp.]|nr:helix-turn-helix transcriptional regulator [Akkermansia sp.]